jgi:hypothetical protein
MEGYFHKHLNVNGSVLMVKAEILKRAKDVERKYLIADGCYILGVLEKGVTVYNQQVRAHNLAWALWELKRTDIKNVAIIGGGIGGVTFAACVLSIFDKSTKLQYLKDCPISILFSRGVTLDGFIRESMGGQSMVAVHLEHPCRY